MARCEVRGRRPPVGVGDRGGRRDAGGSRRDARARRARPRRPRDPPASRPRRAPLQSARHALEARAALGVTRRPSQPPPSWHVAGGSAIGSIGRPQLRHGSSSLVGTPQHPGTFRQSTPSHPNLAGRNTTIENDRGLCCRTARHGQSAPRSPGRADHSAKATECLMAGAWPRSPRSETTQPPPCILSLARAHAHIWRGITRPHTRGWRIAHPYVLSILP